MKIYALVAGVLLGLSTVSNGQSIDWNGDPLPAVRINTVAFRGWIPAGTPGPLRGTLVLIPGRHMDGRGMAADPRWQKLAADIHFAIVACQYTNGAPFDYQADLHGDVARSINNAVEHLAAETKHPELAKAPIAFWGESAGSNVSERYCSFFPKRVIAFASSTGTRGPGDLAPGKTEIPILVVVGAKDKPEWVQGALSSLENGVRQHAPWTLALNKNAGHGTGRALEAEIAFLKAAVELRFNPPATNGRGGMGGNGGSGSQPSIFKSELPKFSQTSANSSAAPVAAPAQLHRVELHAGWLGDPETYEVAAYNEFKGNKSKAIWLPDQAAAQAWRDYLLR